MADHPYHQALRDAVAAAGDNQSRFAREVGTSQQLVSYWLANGKPLPGELVIPAERAGFGKRHVLRPDLYPLDDSGSKEARAA
jgi:DNA-binding transcriptional regulator YdaS (Cro superfamily)